MKQTPKKLLTTNWQKHIIIFAFENRKYIVSPNIKILFAFGVI